MIQDPEARQMTNLRAAIACEYAMHCFRAADTYESANEIYGVDASAAIASRSADGIKNLRDAAELLGFTLTPINQQHGGTRRTREPSG